MPPLVKALDKTLQPPSGLVLIVDKKFAVHVIPLMVVSTEMKLG